MSRTGYKVSVAIPVIAELLLPRLGRVVSFDGCFQSIQTVIGISLLKGIGNARYRYLLCEDVAIVSSRAVTVLELEKTVIRRTCKNRGQAMRSIRVAAFLCEQPRLGGGRVVEKFVVCTTVSADHDGKFHLFFDG